MATKQPEAEADLAEFYAADKADRVTAAAAARAVGTSKYTLYRRINEGLVRNWRLAGKGPRFVLLSEVRKLFEQDGSVPKPTARLRRARRKSSLSSVADRAFGKKKGGGKG